MSQTKSRFTLFKQYLVLQDLRVEMGDDGRCYAFLAHLINGLPDSCSLTSGKIVCKAYYFRRSQVLKFFGFASNSFYLCRSESESFDYL